MTDEKNTPRVDKIRESILDVSDLFKIVNEPDPAAGGGNTETETEAPEK